MTKSLPLKSLVLYADDDPDDIEFVTEAFNAYDHSVDLKTFKDGEDLLAYLEKRAEPHPCLIILDINMPKMNGKDALRHLRAMPGFEQVPVVLFSTSTLPAEMEFAKQFDAGFITKPLHFSQIRQLVDQMIDFCSDDVKKNIRRLRL